jgi:aspartate/methionine/tyrosine aminotransferase
MKIQPFALERWQSVWENRVGVVLSESGVHPLSVEELVEDRDLLKSVLTTRLSYPQTNGSELTRTRVADLYPGAGANNVLITAGCSEANFIITWALVEPGDEVVFMQPNYMQVAGVAQSLGAAVKPLWLREHLRWSVDEGELQTLITSRTKLVVICNPDNPTGSVLPEKTMDAVCHRAAQVGAWILADEEYRGAELQGPLTPTFWGRYERVLCTSGFSKAYSLPGLRTGWIVGSSEMVERLWGYHDYTSVAPSKCSPIA